MNQLLWFLSKSAATKRSSQKITELCEKESRFLKKTSSVEKKLEIHELKSSNLSHFADSEKNHINVRKALNDGKSSAASEPSLESLNVWLSANLKKLLVQVESAAHFEKKLKSSFFEIVLLKFEFFYEIKEDNRV